MELPEAKQHDGLPSIDSLVERANKLLVELTQFKEHAASKRYRQRNIPMRDFEGGIRSEIEHLHRVEKSKARDLEDGDRKVAAAIRSSNLSAYEMIWATAKRSRGVTSFRQWFRLSPIPAARREENNRKQVKRALVDVVTEDGEQWIKVSSITEKRLLFDFAKEGWGRFGEDGSDFGSEDSRSDFDGDVNVVNGNAKGDDVPDIPLLRSARDLVIAARTNRVRGRIPKVRVVLPRISRGQSNEVDRLLSKIEDYGCMLTLAADVPERDLHMSEVIDQMPVNPEAGLGSILNVDCTILISLVSDISHVANLKPEPWYNAMLREQLRFEREETLLPNMLYPVLEGRRLVTTKKAAEQCQLIVDTIGNEGEKARCDALLGQRISADARTLFTGMSDHYLSPNVQLPVEIVRDDTLPKGISPKSELSQALIDKVCSGLSDINRSVFGFGWKTGWTTITSNNNTVRELESLLEEHRAKDGSEDDVAAPDTWICLPRSVVGKYDEVRQSRKEKRNVNKELQFQTDDVGR